MVLSDKAEKGRKTALIVSVMCFAVSLFSLASFNILMAGIGFAAAYHIGKGSLTARNFAVILTISEIPVLAVMIVFMARQLVLAYIIAAAIILVLDAIALLLLLFNKNLGIYFREVFEANADEIKE